MSGKPREIEIWFGLAGRTLYMLSGGRDRSELGEEPAAISREVSVRIGDVTEPGRARVVEERGEDERARELLFDKYSARYSGDLEDWRRTALPIAVDFDQR